MAFTKSLGGGGGATFTTKDEGSTLSSSVTTIDFVGDGVTASGAGATTTVTIPGALGSTSYTIFDPDTLPASAHADDNEGTGTAGASVAGFTAFNAGTSTLTYDGIGRMQLYVPVANGDQPRLYYKTTPGGNWTQTAKLTPQFMGSGFGTVSIAARDGSTGRLILCGVQIRNGPIYSLWQKWNTVTSFNSESNAAQIDLSSWHRRPVYVQMSWNGSNLTLRMKINPREDWISMLSADTFVAAPTQYGIAVNAHSSGDAYGFYDFWRAKAATTDTIGGDRDVVLL